VKLCPVSAFADIVKDWPKIRNLPNLFLRIFENVDPDVIIHKEHESTYIKNHNELGVFPAVNYVGPKLM